MKRRVKLDSDNYINFVLFYESCVGPGTIHQEGPSGVL